VRKKVVARADDAQSEGAPLPAEAARADRRLGRPPLLTDPRAEILQQAARLFAAQGYAESSLAQVAAAMNYSKGAIYNYFASKQEIYDAIIVATLRGLHEAGLAAAEAEAPPPERLKRFMIAHACYLAENSDAFLTMLVGFSGMSDAQRADALRLRDAHEGVLRAIIASGVEDGSFRGVEPAIVGRAVLSMLSWMARWFRADGEKSAQDVALDYYDLIVRGLRPAEA
jgi:AcrR family transcriptional regulator